MGVFGFQIVLTMVVASFIHKLSPYYSFGRWFVTRNLKYYTFVSNTTNNTNATGQKQEETVDHNHGKARNRGKKNGRGSASNSRRPTEDVLHIEECSLNYLNLHIMHFSDELKWMLDLMIAVCFVFISTTIYYYMNPSSLNDQMNLSVIWIGFLTMYILIILFRLMQIYLDPKLPSERRTQLLLSALMIVLVVLILSIESSVFNFNLSDNLDVINQVVADRFNLTLSKSTPLIPMLYLKGFIGVISSLLSVLLIFPLLNYSNVHFESVKGVRKFSRKTLQNISFIFPLVCASFWIKGTIDDEAHPKSHGYYKIVAILILCFTRFVIFQKLMQTYFNRAKEIAVSDSSEELSHVKHRMTSVFIFYCCAATQYLGPVVLLMMFAFLYTISSSYFGIIGGSSSTEQSADNDRVVSLLTASIFEGTFSFLSWWTCFCMFIVPSMGSVIHSYFQS